MSSLNKVMLIGHLGAAPELRRLETGVAAANFSLATNERWTNKRGEIGERTEWHRIVAWGKLGEICGQYLSKGRQVYIEGRLQTREWEDKQGNKRKTTEVIAREMQMLGGRGEGGDRPQQAAGTPEFAAETVKIEDDDLPF